MNREEWLTKGIEKLTPMFNAVGVTIPENVKVSCGFCKSQSSIGLCCPETRSEGKMIEIFIDPQIAESARVLDVLAHELIHAFLFKENKRHGHGGKFKRIAEKIGLLPPMKATTASPLLKEKLEAIVNEIGEYPHFEYHNIRLTRSTPDEEKSKTFVCPCREYQVTVKNKYSDVADPVCPLCGQTMRIKKKGEKLDQFELEDFCGENRR